MAASPVAAAGPRAAGAVAPLALVAALLSAACWGLGLVAAKAALDGGEPPLTLAAVQLAASVAVLAPAAAVLRPRVAWREAARRAAPSGVLEYAASYGLFAAGMALTTAGNAAVINAAEPVMIAALAALLLGERAGPRLLLLLGLVTAGLVFVVWPDLRALGAPHAGDLLVLASMATGALYAVLCRDLVAAIAPLPLALAQQFAGLAALACALLAGLALGLAEPGLGTPAALGLAALSGLLQHTAAVWLHLHALRRMPAGAFAVFLALVPVIALAAAHALLGEAVTAPQLAGGALIAAAALAAGRGAARTKPEGTMP